MGKHYKLPFTLKVDRKYNDINIEDFLTDWIENKKDRQTRTVEMDNLLHIELKKFETFNISFDEIIDLAIRYALSKIEFTRLASQIIENKK